MALGELGFADSMPAQARLLDIPPGRVVRWVFEHGPTVPARRLRGAALLVELPKALLKRVAGAAFQSQVDRQHDFVSDGPESEGALPIVER